MTMPTLPEVLIILFVMLLVFGAGQLRALGEALGKGISSLEESVGKDGERVKEE